MDPPQRGINYPNGNPNKKAGRGVTAPLYPRKGLSAVEPSGETDRGCDFRGYDYRGSITYITNYVYIDSP